MKLRLLCIVALTLAVSLHVPGCLTNRNDQAPPAVRQLTAPGAPATPAASTPARIAAAGRAAAGAIDAASPVADELAKATGRDISPDTAARGAAAASKVTTIANTGAGIAATIAAVPGPQQPIAATIAAILAAIGTVGGATTTFLERRKHRRTTRALGTVLQVVNDTPKIGGAIQSAATARGISDVVEAEYRNSVAQ